jgi:hypothetical protein
MPIVDDEMITRRICCDDRDVVFIKSVASAYEGLCCLFSFGKGGIVLAAAKGREAELDRLVDDLREEFAQRGSRFETDDSPTAGVAAPQKML